ncbi:DegT/DnrJ/EryC1/StrS family aminotransferase [bacterium]|nr:DegT/DnrJ/EryC1/StrS family aminotransferase [bacterium]
MNIQMVDLHSQYLDIKHEIDTALQEVLNTTAFIRGPEVSAFEAELSHYLDGSSVLGVANGTDALQIALMALHIGPGDEVISPSFTFVATAEAVGLLGATPVFADVLPDTFNMDPAQLEALITPRTKAIVPVHLFGQCANMTEIKAIADKHGLPIVEDTAQAIGSTWQGQAAGTIGDIGTLSFFPSKNLGCYGDGGAIVSRRPELFEQCRLISNHGSRKKYHNEVVGVNSRLDSMQAAILRVKLSHLDSYTEARVLAANRYDALFSDSSDLVTPFRDPRGSHVFHQYTLRVKGNDPEKRDALQAYLATKGIPSFVYYPVPLHLLPIYKDNPDSCICGPLSNTLCAANEVLSLPIHTHLTQSEQEFIAGHCNAFFSSL